MRCIVVGWQCWLVATLVVCFGLVPASADSINNLRNVCTANFEPLVRCSADNLEEPVGYHISLFKVAARSLGLSNYTFKCLPFSEMITDILEGGNECDIGIGGITLTSERMRKGIHFSFPTYRGSLGIMVKGKVRKGATWSFLQPLDWTLWSAIGVTSLVVPLIVFFTESLSCHGFIHRRDMSRGLKQAIWDSFITLLNFGNFTVKSQEARLIVIGYGFLVLILVNTYVANLAAFLTITHIDASIKSVEDLQGKRVSAGAVYERRLLSQRILVQSNFTSAMKDDVVQDFIKKDEFDAVIYDEPWITFQASLDCGLFTLQETISPFDYAFALPNRSKRIEEIISKELIALQESGQMSELSKEFVQVASSDCPVEDEVSETESVDFNQLKGLWIILGCCLATSLVIMFLKWTRVIKLNGSTQQAHSIRELKRLETTVETMYHPHAVKVHAAESLRAMNVRVPDSVKKKAPVGLQSMGSILETGGSGPDESSSSEQNLDGESIMEDCQRKLDRLQEDVEKELHDLREFVGVLMEHLEKQKHGLVQP